MDLPQLARFIGIITQETIDTVLLTKLLDNKPSTTYHLGERRSGVTETAALYCALYILEDPLAEIAYVGFHHEQAVRFLKRVRYYLVAFGQDYPIRSPGRIRGLTAFSVKVIYNKVCGRTFDAMVCDDYLLYHTDDFDRLLEVAFTNSKRQILLSTIE